MPRYDVSVEAPEPSEVSEHDGAAGESEEGEAAESDEPRPEDVREGVVDIVAYAVGAVALMALGYFTQRAVLTWTRGPFTVVCVVMAVHWTGRWIGRRVRVRRDRSGGVR